MINYKYFTYKLCLLVLFCGLSVQAQNSKRTQLEAQKREFIRQINEFERLVSQEKKEQKSILSNLDNINYKISVRQNIIRITNQQANLLTREINDNQKQISTLRSRLKVLKEEYAAMVVKSYKSRSEDSKIMFLLSSNNFQQAYKRLQYIKQYANYQKKQSEEIKTQTEKLQELNKSLLKQKKDKQQLVEENRIAKQKLDIELKDYNTLMASVNANISKHRSEIKTRQRQIDKIDKEIQKIIREAIAESNRKAGKSTKSKTFALTPEEKVLASSFTANKGKLPWPVREGVITLGYGKRRSPINKTSQIKSYGIRITTNKGEKVRAVFKGTVLSIILPKNGNNSILIKHGNYITIYKNLSKIFVKQGDVIDTKQIIGEVKLNQSGQSILSFQIWKGMNSQNPAYWIKR